MATVSDLPSKYTCVMCKGLLNTPYLTECCGQQFCKSCLEGPTRTPPEFCPCCETGPPDFKFILYKPIKEEIDNLKIFCPRKLNGCDKIIRHAELHKHEQECEYVIIDCRKCGAHVFRRDFVNHMQTRCPQREVVCSYCREKGTHNNITGKHQLVCPEMVIECEKMCGMKFKRKDLDKHKQMCPEEEYTCPFYEAGCYVPLKRRNLDKHMESNVQHHLCLLMQAYTSIKQELHELKNQGQEKL